MLVLPAGSFELVAEGPLTHRCVGNVPISKPVAGLPMKPGARASRRNAAPAEHASASLGAQSRTLSAHFYYHSPASLTCSASSARPQPARASGLVTMLRGWPARHRWWRVRSCKAPHCGQQCTDAAEGREEASAACSSFKVARCVLSGPIPMLNYAEDCVVNYYSRPCSVCLPGFQSISFWAGAAPKPRLQAACLPQPTGTSFRID